MERTPSELSGCLWICPALLPAQGWLQERDREGGGRLREAPEGCLDPPPPLETLFSLSYEGVLPSLVDKSPSQTYQPPPLALTPRQPLLTCSRGRRGRPTSPRGLRTSPACTHQSSCGRGNTGSGKARNWVLGLVLRRAAHLFPLCQPTNWGRGMNSDLSPSPQQGRIGGRVSQMWTVLAQPSALPTMPGPPQPYRLLLPGQLLGVTRPVPTHVVDLLLVLPTVATVVHLGEDILGYVGHSAIAVLVTRGLACRPPSGPRVGTHHGHQLCQVNRVPGIEGQSPTVMAVMVRQVGSMVHVVGVWGMQGCGARWRLLPGAFTGPYTATTTLPGEQGLMLS